MKSKTPKAKSKAGRPLHEFHAVFSQAILDEANLKLKSAEAVSDLLAMTHVYHVDGIKDGTVGTAALLVTDLIDEARELIGKAEARP